MTGLSVAAEAATVQFDDTRALDEVTLTWPANQIHGLLGRNGAGKSTLLGLIGSLRTPDGGRVLVDGAEPFENAGLTEQICLIRESGDVLGDEKISVNLDMQERTRPTFDREYADVLVEAFGLPVKKKTSALSRGQSSAFGVVVGLASRCPVTIFDEVHLGMDAPSRQLFYDALLADFGQNPRTFVLSSHLISEIENMLETVTILHRGSVLLQTDAEQIRGRGVTITGPTRALDALIQTHPVTVIGRRDLGPTSQITLYGDLPETVLDRAQQDGMSVGAVPLQDLFIHLTSDAAGTVAYAKEDA